jgi:uncharacterized repeat protein (TIGR03917 family)
MAKPAPRPVPTAFPRVPSRPPALADLAGSVAQRAEFRPAVGYVCVPDGDEERINGLHHRLARQAQRAGLDLVEVYADRQIPGDEMTRPGLALAVDEIGRRPDAVLLLPDLTHLPATAQGWAALEKRFTSVVTEIRTLSPAPCPAAVPTPVPTTRRAGEAAEPPVEASRARLTAEGLFEVTIRPDDDVADVTAVLRQLPTAARFLESYGDVDTTLAFRPAPPTAGSEPVADQVRSCAGR